MSDHHVCPWWLAYTFDNPLRRLFHNPAKLFEGLVQPGMIVMDMGCGMGYFSLGMAKMVGDTGMVMAVDLQQKMLDILLKRALRAGLSHMIRTHLSNADNLGCSTMVDFILAFWMVHETPDPENFFRQTRNILKPNGRIFYAEPAFHVTAKQYTNILVAAEKAGLRKIKDLDVRLSRASLLTADHHHA